MSVTGSDLAAKRGQYWQEAREAIHACTEAFILGAVVGMTFGFVDILRSWLI